MMRDFVIKTIYQIKKAEKEALEKCRNRNKNQMGLTNREVAVLVYRFGLYGQKPLRVIEIAQMFKVTSKRIYQIQIKAIRLLLHPSRRKSDIIRELIKSPLIKKLKNKSYVEYWKEIRKR